jgi:chorismate synthase
VKRLRYLTAGESHGPALVGILEGLPAGLPVLAERIDRDLARRQMGYGRGGRMRIEKDQADILAGIRFGLTLGSPVALMVRNKDFANWTERMGAAPGGPDPRPVKIPRPGHADLAGGLKYGHLGDLRNVLERASARETAIRVALGAVAKALLAEFGIRIGSYVRSIGGVEAAHAEDVCPDLLREDAEALAMRADQSETRALDPESSERLVARIHEAMKRRDTLGGVVEVVATGVPIGLGSHVHWDRKLDGRIAQAMASIPAIKAVEVGDGWKGAARFGSEVHDPIHRGTDRLTRWSNHAGGTEGGITNGEPLIVRIAMKPIATVSNALPSVDVHALEPTPAHVERSDTCAVPAAGVVAEAVLALTLADALLEVVPGDTLAQMRTPFARLRLSERFAPGHIFLLGPMGAGKTSVGQRLAERLDAPFVDLDARVEKRAGMSVAELFKTKGEEAFRSLEAKVLAEVAEEPASIVALGGGTPLNERAWRILRHTGVAVRLSASVASLVSRLEQQGGLAQRPLLANEDPAARLDELLQRREPWYARADVTVDADGMSVEEATGAVLAALRSVEGPLAAVARSGKGGDEA